jgi:hypothetical protein
MSKATMMRVVGVFALLTLLVFPATAATVVIPNTNENVPGPSNNAFPLNAGTPMRYQQVYAANQFQGLSGPVTQFAFRVDESAGNPFNGAQIDTEIRLCHTNVNPQGMSTTFANNLGNDVTLVFDGILTLSSAGNPGVFDIVVNINDTFNYNGNQNLLIEIKTFTAPNTSQFDSAGTGVGEGGTPWTDRIWAFDPNATDGIHAGDDGYVTQFTFEPITPVQQTTWGVIKSIYQAGL